MEIMWMRSFYNKAPFFLFFGSLIFTSCSQQLYKARFVLLPDTQYYTEKFPEVLDSQINWVKVHADDIDLVMQQGDLTQNNSAEEWQRVKNAFSRIQNVIPTVLAVGNHDMGSAPGKFADVRNTSLFNQYFPYDYLAKHPAFGGAFENGRSENVFYFVNTGKIKWLVLTLEFGPRNAVLDWANEIAAAHPNHTIILNTHSYMYSDSTRQGPGDKWRPQNYGVGRDTGDAAPNDGEEIWNKLVKKHPNIRFVFSGHILNTGVGTLVSINDAGLPVYQMLANYQSEVEGSVHGGNGCLRILDLNMKKNTLKVSTWSPFVNQTLERPGQNFSIRHVLYKPNADQ